MQLFSADATILFFFKNMFFCPQKVEKPPSKVAQKNSNPLFFLTAWAAQYAQTEEFMLQNVVYRPTVYRAGEGAFLFGYFLLSIPKSLK